MGKSTEAGSISLGVKLSGIGLVKQTKSIGNKAGRSLGQSMNNSFSKMVKGLTAMLGTVAITNFAKECIDLGSNLSEVQNVVDTAFTTMNNQLNDWAKNAITNFGLSENYAKKYASTLGSMSKSMGLSEAKAYEMSTAVTGLVGDVASFYNLDAEIPYTKLKGIWTGETEALKDLGVVMTQTALDEYALNNGLGKTTAKMTEQEKIMLRYQYVTNALSCATGDFVKTQDSWANQTRVLSLRFESLKATLGQGLINVFTPVIKIINTVIEKLQVLADKFSTFTEGLFGKSESSTALSNMANSAIDVSGGIDSITESSKAAAKQLAGFDKITKLGDSDTSSSSSNLSTAGTGKGSTVTLPTISADNSNEEGLLEKIKSNIVLFEKWCKDNFGVSIKSGISNITKELSNGAIGIKSAWSDIQTLVQPLSEVFEKKAPATINSYITLVTNNISSAVSTINTIFSDIWTIVMPILSKFVSEGLPILLEFGTELYGLLDKINQKFFEIFNKIWSEALAPFIGKIASIVLEIGTILSEFWNNYGSVLFAKAKEAVDNLAATFNEIWDNILMPIFDSAMLIISELWDNHLKPLIDNAVNAVGEITSCILDLWNKTLSPVIKWIVKTFGPTFANIFKSIFKQVSTIISGVIDTINGLITTLKGIVQFITGVFTGDWGKAWGGIKNIFKGVWDSFVAIVKTPINLIIGCINSVMKAFTTAINTVLKALNKISVKVPDWVPGIGGKKFGFNFKTVAAPQIPKLAEGAYVKPNTPQLAMIGDNRHQGEVVAPEDKLTEMAMAAVRAASGNEYSLEILKALKEILEILKNLNLDIVIDGKKLKDIIVDKINQHTRQTGVCEIIT